MCNKTHFNYIENLSSRRNVQFSSKTNVPAAFKLLRNLLPKDFVCRRNVKFCVQN